eukprot:jgi/Chlat1/4632/Chrsp3S05590
MASSVAERVAAARRVVLQRRIAKELRDSLVASSNSNSNTHKAAAAGGGGGGGGGGEEEQAAAAAALIGSEGGGEGGQSRSGVVEQRIQQAMREGDFTNLRGKGKPLVLVTNPHVDPAEDMAWRVVGNSGFAPEWVQLQRDISGDIRRWRDALIAQARLRQQQHRQPDAVDDAWAAARWRAELARLEGELFAINRRVLLYNLKAPFGLQARPYAMARELARLPATFPPLPHATPYTTHRTSPSYARSPSSSSSSALTVVGGGDERRGTLWRISDAIHNWFSSLA